MTTTARLFRNGRSQAVRLPREFRFAGDRVRVRRAGRGVLVEPMFTDVPAWFAELDRLASEPFMPNGRQQPSTPHGRYSTKKTLVTSNAKEFGRVAGLKWEDWAASRR